MVSILVAERLQQMPKRSRIIRDVFTRLVACVPASERLMTLRLTNGEVP